jgi:polyisoprenyl-teichoic acid--peptidoglycan teichoic acid transferase
MKQKKQDINPMHDIKKTLSKVLFLFLIVSMSTSACSSISSALPASPQNIAYLGASSDGTATLTPFLPVAATASLAATATPLVSNTPTITATFNTPTPVPWNYGLKFPEGQIRIALFGSDYRPSSGYRTDVIIIVSINPKDGTATAISFPRDLYVTIPGKGEERINTAFSYGGLELFNATMQQNFGFQVDYYVMTNFTGFISIIDNLGGIDVNAAFNFSDKCDLPSAVGGYCNITAGTVHMDGKMALWYVRARYTTSDFDRTRRAQEVVLAIFNRMLRFDIVSKIPSMYSIYKANVETNLDLQTVVALAPAAATIAQDGKHRTYTISTDQVTSYTTTGGAAVLLPNYDEIYPILKQALYTP